jgi:hypothetical protein
LLSPLGAATLVAVAVPSRVTFAYAMLAAALQLFTATVQLKLLRGKALALRYAPLEIVRTYVALFCWARACVSKSLAWRGHAFDIGPGTTLMPPRPSIARRLRHALR